MTPVNFVRQISILMSLPSVLLMGTAAALIVILRDWRLVLLCYALMSAVLALLLSQTIPTEWALLQAVVGGLIAVMLFMSARQLRYVTRPSAGRESGWPQLASLTGFRLLTVAMAGGAFFIVRGDLPTLPMVSPLLNDAIFWLALMGVMGLALHEEPLHAGVALLVVLSAFLLIFFQLTRSRLMIGMLEGWQLLLALAISYLTVSRGLASVEPASPAGSRRWQQ
jgi:hypothetical protein